MTSPTQEPTTAALVTPEPDEALQRRLDLLWYGRTQAPQGRPPRFTLAEVVSAGIGIADAEGLAALTMRRVASTLGAAAMSLYTYVPGREELVDLMVDRCFSELQLPDGSRSWRTEMEAVAQSHLDMVLAHRWLLELNRWRLPLAPHVFDADEAVFATLTRAGLPAPRVVAAWELMVGLIHGFARAVVIEQTSASESGSHDEHWQRSESFWETHFDPQRYPTMVSLWSAGAFDATQGGLSDTLAPLLDGLEQLLSDPR